MPSKNGHPRFLPNQIPAPMRGDVHICSLLHQPVIHLFSTLEIHLVDQGCGARDWPMARMTWEPQSGRQGQQCEPLGYVLASALSGLLCCLHLCTRQASGGKQGQEVFCNISGVYSI